jgi:DNA-binding protein HU-beta
MTLQDLITRVAERSGESKKAVDNVLRGLGYEVAVQMMHVDGEVPLPGIGKIKSVTRAARTGRDPRTGAEIAIGAKNTAKLVPAKALLVAIA